MSNNTVERSCYSNVKFLPVSLHARGCQALAVLLLVVSAALPVAAVEQTPPQTPQEQALTPAVDKKETHAGGQSEQHSVLNSAPIELQDLESAGQTFISLYNYLLPVSQDKDASDVCQALAIEKYVAQCETVLNKRINWLKSLSGITGAQFPEGTITINKELKDAVDIQWKEVLFFGEKSQTGNHHLRLFYTKIDNNWKVRQIEEVK